MVLASARSLASAVAGRALDLALPASCAGCGREGAPICAGCRVELEVRLAADPGVALGLPAEIPAPLLQLEWCAPFTGVARRALHALKYGGERRLAGPLGEAIARRWERVGAGGDVLVPVPASPDRVRDRGYDHAVLLAREAGRRLRLPVRDVLARTRATAAQFDLDRGARATNLEHAFALGGAAADRSFHDAWVVLVDDVVTTGATLAACASVLVEAGAYGVSAVTVARER